MLSPRPESKSSGWSASEQEEPTCSWSASLRVLVESAQSVSELEAQANGRDAVRARTRQHGRHCPNETVDLLQTRLDLAILEDHRCRSIGAGGTREQKSILIIGECRIDLLDGITLAARLRAPRRHLISC